MAHHNKEENANGLPKGSYVLISDSQLRDALPAWAAGTFHDSTAKARIIRNNPDYANSVFLDAETDNPFNQGTEALK